MGPTELSEQIVLVRKLRAAGVLFCAVPNGGWRDRRGARMLRASGVEAGVPDLLVFDLPNDGSCGVALELKRQGASKSSLRPAQKRWLEALSDRGWTTIVAFGAEDALCQLRNLGYLKTE